MYTKFHTINLLLTVKERLDSGQPMPDYLRNHPVYYAGPAKTPMNYPSGSFGPTTAGRMDSYVDQFQQAGGSMIMLAKGNRSKAVSQCLLTCELVLLTYCRIHSLFLNILNCST